MNKLTLGKEIGVPIARGFDVTNFFKDVPKVPKSILRLEMTSIHFSRVLKVSNRLWEGIQGFWQPKDRMYQIVFRIYLRFQCLFQGGEQPIIPSRGSLNEYMSHENGDKGLGSLKNGCTQDSKVRSGVGEDLQSLIKGSKGIYRP